MAQQAHRVKSLRQPRCLVSRQTLQSPNVIIFAAESRVTQNVRIRRHSYVCVRFFFSMDHNVANAWEPLLLQLLLSLEVAWLFAVHCHPVRLHALALFPLLQVFISITGTLPTHPLLSSTRINSATEAPRVQPTATAVKSTSNTTSTGITSSQLTLFSGGGRNMIIVDPALFFGIMLLTSIAGFVCVWR
jgi:hypothetical protein